MSNELDDLNRELQDCTEAITKWLQAKMDNFQMYRLTELVPTKFRVENKLLPYTYRGETWPVAIIHIDEFPRERGAYQSLFSTLEDHKIYSLYGKFTEDSINEDIDHKALETVYCIVSERVIPHNEHLTMMREFEEDLQIHALKKANNLK